MNNSFVVNMPEPKKLMIIDCQVSGVAGDMILGALINLGANADKVVSAIKTLENPGYGYKNIKIKIEQVTRGEFKATNVDVTSETADKTQRSELVHIVEDAASKLALSAKAKQFASKVIHTLVDVEADLHNTGFDDGALDEVALVDTAAEIIGTAVALDDLGLFNSKIYSTPVAVGGGAIKISHGIVSSPAPATLAILQSKKFPFHGGPIEAELATPTGASILVNLVDEVSRFYPSTIPLEIGYGAGTKNFDGLPAVLRLTSGQALDDELGEAGIAVLETNVDDVSGEMVGYLVDKLLAEGAKDVSIIPMYSKKNRPGQIINIIANPKDIQHLSQMVINETGTLGVRVHFCEKHIVVSELCSVDLIINGVAEQVKIKVSKNSSGEIIRMKPEFDDLKRLAEKNNMPLRVLSELAVTNARKQLTHIDRLQDQNIN